VGHLTERTYARLIRGDLSPEEARAIVQHLDAPCAACEEFLAARPVADALDGRVDAALGVVAGARGRGNDLEFARIERRLRVVPPPARRSPRRVLPAVAAAAVIVAGLGGLLVLPGQREQPAWDGVKGGAPGAAPVRLRFAVVSPTRGGAPDVEKGVSGQVVQRGASLQFEIEAGRPAQAALVRVPASGPPELVWSDRVASGRSAVTVEGRPAAYPLADLEGVQRFVLVASEERLAPDRVARAASAVAPPAPVGPALGARGGLVLDVVDVEVR
jgi:hypothetical protein